jgi:tRNA (cmo5U34)-methyltransferase
VYGQDFEAHLLDLSAPMLLRAATRLGQLNQAPIQAIQVDFREASLADHAYDVVLAAAVLHHLRDEADWEQAFQKLHRITAPGGSVWITDLAEHSAIRRRISHFRLCERLSGKCPIGISVIRLTMQK